MEEKDKFIYYKGQQYIPVKSTIHKGIKYVFVINYKNPKDIMFLSFDNEIEEVENLELIKIILNQM